jgi:hypothetical protein
VSPSIPIAGGAEVVTGRTLVNDRAICPSREFPDQEIQERVPESETIRTERVSLGLLGDGLVELVSDDLLRSFAGWQCRETGGRICGKAIVVPVLEAPGTYAVGRFGWKSQHASLLSFAADAYLNEMGITSRLLPDEVTELCDTVADPEDRPHGGGLADIDRFARFVRATKAPPRDAALAGTAAAVKGSALFDAVGCATCHVRTLATAPAGTRFHAGQLVVPPALGGKAFHPFGDFLLHDVGTGDGVALAVVEHAGKAYAFMQPQFEPTANRLRTPPLWGLRTRSRLMHDGLSLTQRDAILRHRGEADDARRRFERLRQEEQAGAEAPRPRPVSGPGLPLPVLVDAEDVALRVAEPGGALGAQHAHALDCLEAGQVVLLEAHAARAKSLHLGGDVAHLEGQGRVIGAGRGGARVERERRPPGLVPGLAVWAFAAGRKAQRLLVELPGAGHLDDGQHRRGPGVRQHAALLAGYAR